MSDLLNFCDRQLESEEANSATVDEVWQLRQQVSALTQELQLSQEELIQCYDQLQSVYYWAATTDAISRAATIEEIYHLSVSGLQQVCNCQWAEISLLDEEYGVFQFQAWQNFSEEYIKAMGGYSPWIDQIPHSLPILIPDIENISQDSLFDQVLGDKQATILSEGIQSIAWIPILQQGKLIGHLGIYSSYPHKFDDTTIHLAQTLANYIIFAIERKQSEVRLQATLEQLQRTQVQLIQSEKMSSLGQLVAGVAHEINNPVNFIWGNLIYANNYTQDILKMFQLYEKYYPQPVQEIEKFAEEIDLNYLATDLPQILESMKVGAERIRQIVLSLRTFSRIDEADMKQVNIHEGIDSTLMVLEHRLKCKPEHPAIEVIKDYNLHLPLVECYAGQLNQVFMHIITNAIDALEGNYFTVDNGEKHQFASQIKICTRLISDNQVQIAIKDNGIGIPENIQGRLFDPFFTTKPIGQGTGMGLSISYQIITEQHGGLLQCFSTLGKGTEFLITIPLEQSDVAEKIASTTQTLPS